MRRFATIAILVLGVGVGGCDKCGHRIDLQTPSIQHACGDNSQSH